VIALTVSGAVAEIVLAHTEARNAIDPGFVDALSVAVEDCSRREAVRAVLLRAEGPAFTVGGDLAHFAAHLDELPEQLDAMITRYHATLRTLAELPVPVVCAAQGAIAGGGLGLLWAADVVLLADDAKLASGFSRLGLSGDGGSSWYLPRLLGLRRAMQLIVQARVFSAAEAVDWGLADRAVAPEALAAVAADTARTLAAGPTLAYGEMRGLIRESFDRSLAQGLDAELAAIVRCGTTADAREGIRSFVERRSPNFGGG
jgi:enoyl-CoA hydratase/carnithine racemase